MIKYQTQLDNLDSFDIEGFFVGWPNPPRKETFLRLLSNSYKVVLAIDGKKLIGFISSISDGVLSAYIPFLEVLPEYQSNGVGAMLISKIKDELNHLYMIDLLCDENLIPYYQKQHMQKATGAMIRNYENLNGASKE